MSVALKQQPEPELRLDVVEGRDAFVQLEREWNAALSRGPRDEPMLRHEWLRAWIENFAPGATLRTFMARAGKEICAAVPLIETTERSADTCFVPMTTWHTPSNDHSQRGGVLLGRRGEEGLRMIWERLAETPGWDRLRLRDLPAVCAAVTATCSGLRVVGSMRKAAGLWKLSANNSSGVRGNTSAIG